MLKWLIANVLQIEIILITNLSFFGKFTDLGSNFANQNLFFTFVLTKFRYNER